MFILSLLYSGFNSCKKICLTLTLALLIICAMDVCYLVNLDRFKLKDMNERTRKQVGLDYVGDLVEVHV